jgi:hypothetical protein
MALADSGTAIGAVTRLLREHLLRRGFEVTIGKPETAANTDTSSKLNLFLYEATFDPQLRNFSLHEGALPPLWLVLKYLLTAFDAGEKSDTAAAHELLGRGALALHSLNFLQLDPLVDPAVRRALEHNPEPLKLTFDDAGADLVSKLMQGAEERYRLSLAFQMRPVMIVPDKPPRGALLVGVNYQTEPDTVIGREGVQVTVLPSLGARLERVDPERFEPGARLTVYGLDLAASDLEFVLGDIVLQVLEREPGRVLALAEGAPGTPIADGAALSAGTLPLAVRRRLSPTRTLSNDLLAARLLPGLAAAAIVGGALRLTGVLLGTSRDDITVLFARETDGETVHRFDTVVTTPNQKTLTVTGAAAAVAPGTYRVILHVNGQQARSSPSVTI